MLPLRGVQRLHADQAAQRQRAAPRNASLPRRRLLARRAGAGGPLHPAGGVLHGGERGQGHPHRRALARAAHQQPCGRRLLHPPQVRPQGRPHRQRAVHLRGAESRGQPAVGRGARRANAATSGGPGAAAVCAPGGDARRGRRLRGGVPQQHGRVGRLRGQAARAAGGARGVSVHRVTSRLRAHPLLPGGPAGHVCRPAQGGAGRRPRSWRRGCSPVCVRWWTPRGWPATS